MFSHIILVSTMRNQTTIHFMAFSFKEAQTAEARRADVIVEGSRIRAVEDVRRIASRTWSFLFVSRPIAGYDQESM